MATAEPIVFDQADVEANKTIVVIFSIILWLFFLSFCVDSAKNSPYVKFFANNSLVLLIALVICGIIPIIGWIAEIGVLVLMVMNIINAVNGQGKELPLIGGIKILK